MAENDPGGAPAGGARVLPDESATAAIGKRLAATLGPGDVLCLSGDLGAGKSTFARALIREAVGDPYLEVPSPTFTLIQSYPSVAGEIWHFDLYRLANPDEVIELGWEEALDGGIVVVEWPDRLGRLLPCERLDIALATHDDYDGRSLTMTPVGGRWRYRLAAAGLGRFDPGTEANR